MLRTRKTRNLPKANEKEKSNQMSFFDPVYQNDGFPISDNESGNEFSSTNLTRPKMYRDTKKNESNDTLEATPSNKALTAQKRADTNDDQEQSSEISISKIAARIKQIQNSIEQARNMYESMNKMKDLVPGSEEQCEKLRVIIANLEEQQLGYVNLYNLIELTTQEKSILLHKLAKAAHAANKSRNDESNLNDEEIGDEDDEEIDEDDDDDLSSRRNTRSPVRRPRIESKIGFTPHPAAPLTPTVPPTISSSDNEQNNRNDNSNYDSLIGSLKSDTLNWKDQQSTSGDEGSEGESEKEIERNLMLQKEQLRALQGRKRALLALKKRSEQRLVEQQQVTSKKPSKPRDNLDENDVLSDISNLRDRLKLLRNLYEQKHETEVQQLKSSSTNQKLTSNGREKNLDYVREQLSKLESIIGDYQMDLNDQPEEETTVYEETPIDPDDVKHLKTLLIQQKQSAPSSSITTPNNHNDDNEKNSKTLDRLSKELAAKRLELEQAKSALSQLQQMAKKIESDESSSPVEPNPSLTLETTVNKQYDVNANHHQYSSTSSQSALARNTNTQPSLLSSILSSKSIEQKNSILNTNTYADAKMAAQHREIERLIESRQRLHTIKDQIASLHQSMGTPPIQGNKGLSTNEAQLNVPKLTKQDKAYEDELNNSKNMRSPIMSNEQSDDDDDDSELYRFECESGDGEEIDDNLDEEIQPRIKQGNFHAPEDIVAEHEQRLLNRKTNSTDELNEQIHDVYRCLSTFIQEQRAFNTRIEEHLKTNRNTTTNSTVSTLNTTDPLFNQLQQQVITQGLIVNLNTAYREIAVLQSEVNALQLENSRLTSSHNHRSQSYSREDSRSSLYSFDQIKPIRSETRPKYNGYNQQQKHTLTTNNKFETSSKTSFTSQSTGQQTAIYRDKNMNETTPIKHERKGTYTAECLSTPKAVSLRSKNVSNEYELSSNENNLTRSFLIRRRNGPKEDEPSLIQSQLFNYDQKSQQKRFHINNNNNNNEDDGDDDETDSEDERVNNHLFKDLDNIDAQSLDNQIKSTMGQLIPFMRIYINNIFDQSVLNDIRERLMSLFKLQPDTAKLVHQFPESIDKTLEKYCGTAVCDSAVNLVRDLSDVVFSELIKQKVYTNQRNNETQKINDEIKQSLNKQQDDYSTDDLCVDQYQQQMSLGDDGDNDNKYQIELAESERRPLMLIASDEEDNDSDQEENKDSELETAVSRQETNLNQNDIPASSDLNSNGHEYILVNESTNNISISETKSVDNEANRNS